MTEYACFICIFHILANFHTPIKNSGLHYFPKTGIWSILHSRSLAFYNKKVILPSHEFNSLVSIPTIQTASHTSSAPVDNLLLHRPCTSQWQCPSHAQWVKMRCTIRWIFWRSVDSTNILQSSIQVPACTSSFMH